MSECYYFKNRNPKQGVVLENFGTVMFDDIDGEVGVIATTRPEVNTALLKHVLNNASTVTSIDASEYEDLKKKQAQGTVSKPRWREELSPSRKQGDTVSPVATQQQRKEHASSTSPAPAAEEARRNLETSEVPEALRPKVRTKASIQKRKS